MGLGAQESDLVYRLDTDVAPEGGRMKEGGKLRDPQYAQANSEQNRLPLFCSWSEEKPSGGETKEKGLVG